MQVNGVAAFRRKINRMVTTEVKRAGVSALNKTVTTSRVQLMARTVKAKKVPLKQVKKRVFITRATAKTLKVVLVGYAKPISLVTLIRNPIPDQGRRRKRKLKVNKKTYDKAFLRTGQNGKVHVFERNGKRGRKGSGRWAGNKNLERLDKVSIEIHRELEKQLPAIQRQVYRQNFHRLFAHEYNFRLSKLK